MMIGTKSIIAGAQRYLGENVDYFYDLAAVSGGAFRGFLRFSRYSALRKHAPKTLIHLARLGSTMEEDCGPCVRIGFRLAKRDGVPEAMLRAALNREYGKFSPEGARAFAFGRAISSGEVAEADRLGEEIETAHGRKVRTELALAAATARVFPALKRGLGYAKSCSITRFEDL